MLRASRLVWHPFSSSSIVRSEPSSALFGGEFTAVVEVDAIVSDDSGAGWSWPFSDCSEHGVAHISFDLALEFVLETASSRQQDPSSVEDCKCEISASKRASIRPGSACFGLCALEAVEGSRVATISYPRCTALTNPRDIVLAFLSKRCPASAKFINRMS